MKILSKIGKKVKIFGFFFQFLNKATSRNFASNDKIFKFWGLQKYLKRKPMGLSKKIIIPWFSLQNPVGFC